MRFIILTTFTLVAVVSALSIPLHPRQTVAACDIDACAIDILSVAGDGVTCVEGDATTIANCLVTTLSDCTGCDPTGATTYLLSGLIPAGSGA